MSYRLACAPLLLLSTPAAAAVREERALSPMELRIEAERPAAPEGTELVPAALQAESEMAKASLPNPPTAAPILITGFDPFAAWNHNPSQEIALAFDGMRVRSEDAEHAVVGRVLPVSFERAGEQIRSSIRELRPAAALMFGLHGGTPEVHVEWTARNVMDNPQFPDADGKTFSRQPIEPGGPAAYLANAPAAALFRLLRGKGFPAALSHDAGAYVCNATYFSALHLVHSLDLEVLTLFTHLPSAREHLSPEQLLQSPDHQPMDLILRAAETLLHEAASYIGKPLARITPIRANPVRTSLIVP